ncbi:MAG: HAMP domain-containing protein, partial [Actinomycetota bacterium]|nr:HAMP domain-containing protein [Actinomycetota bacterium]
MFRSIRWRLAAAFALLILVCAGGFSFYLLHFLRDNYLGNLKSQLTSQARLVGDAGERYFATGQAESIDALAKRLGKQIDARITIIGKSGMVLGDSNEDPLTMENHGKRPEVAEALSAGFGSSIRYSATLGCDMMYVAVPVMVNGEAAGVSRVSFPLAEINESIGYIRRTIIAGTAIAVAVVILLAMWILRSTTVPIKKLTEMSRRVAEGELDQKIEVSSRDEVGELAGAFNQMAAKLKEIVGLLTTERDMMGAILSNMADGIFVVDSESRVTEIN